MQLFFRYISTHLLIVVGLIFAIGIWLSSQISPNPNSLLLIISILGFFTLLCHLRRNRSITTLLALFLFGVLGLLHGINDAQNPSDPTHIYNQISNKREVVLVGVLHSLPEFDGEKSKIEVKLFSIRFQNSKDFIQSQGLVRLSLPGNWPDQLKPGDLMAVRAILDRPGDFKNPGAFSYTKYLMQKDIWIIGKVRSTMHVAPIQSSPSLLNLLRYLPERVRGRIAATIDRSVSQEYSALYKAVLIGDRSGVHKNLLELFKTTGCMHILAISGLHMGIITTLLFVLFYWLLRRSQWLMLHVGVKKMAALLCVPPLILYAAIAGGSTPVFRSLLMSTIVIAAICIDRRKHVFTVLAFAALLLLIIKPLNLFSASFQLSFAAVASIGAIIPYIHQFISHETDVEQPSQLKSKVKIWVVTALLISVSATAGTLPFLLFHFNRFSLVGPFANLLVEPLICLWSLVLGFIAIPFIFIAPPLAVLFFKLGSIGLYFATEVLQFFSSLPIASIYLPTPTILTILSYAFFLLLILCSRHKKVTMIGFVGFCCTLFFFFHTPEMLRAGTKTKSIITFLDVGHGSSTLVQFPGNKTILIDGGALTSKNFDIGENVIAPFLWHKGIRRLDGLIITHPDADHYNGLGFIIRCFKPATLWTNSDTTNNDRYNQLLDLARKQGVSVRVPTENQLLFHTGSAQLTCLIQPEKNNLSLNDRGLIVRYRHDQFSCLFPGDISTFMEKKLVSQNTPLQSTLLLSPHHGSATSNSKLFLHAVRPDVLVISNGHNRYDNLNGSNLSKRCNQLNIDVEATNHKGAVIVESDGRNFEIDRFGK